MKHGRAIEMGWRMLLAALPVALALRAGAAPEIRVRWRAVGSTSYATLSNLASFYGMRETAAATRSPVLASRWSKLTFEVNGRRLVYNGTLVWLHSPLAKVRGRWSLSRPDVENVLDPLLRSREYLRGYRCRTVLIDPGHGGKDTGAIGPTGLKEKDVVLEIADRLRVALANDGFRVYLTRENDRFVELKDRAARARQVGADLMISIHLNAAKDPDPRGLETYVLTARGGLSTAQGGRGTPSTRRETGHADAAASAALGYDVQAGLRKQASSTDRGVRRARYLVLKNAPCPAALVECGFLSNRRNEQLLRSNWYLNLLTTGIGNGVLDYRKRVEAANGAGK